ncbi:MAG: hypothetical protein PHR68_04790 [Candidatus Gracilibacteria bacterium]|nr:hypothetical protein [Candidatus Gracilibacteria bacterium]
MRKDKNNLILGDEINDENSEDSELISIDPGKMLEHIEETQARVGIFLSTKYGKISTTDISENGDLSFINPDEMLENIEERRAKVRAFLSNKPKKIL